MAVRSRTPKTIPAIAAARRVRQKPAVKTGDVVLTVAPFGESPHHRAGARVMASSSRGDLASGRRALPPGAEVILRWVRRVPTQRAVWSAAGHL